MGTVGAAQAQKTMGQYAAFEKRIELLFAKIGQPRPRSQARLEPKGLKVFLNQLVEDGFFGTPPLVVNGFSRRRDELNENVQAVDRKCPS